MDVIKDKLILITGGTGSIGEQLVQTLLENSAIKKLSKNRRFNLFFFDLLIEFEMKYIL